MIVSMVEVANAFYDPGLQRWLNRDPLGDIAGLPLMTADVAPWVDYDDVGAEESNSDSMDAWAQVNQNLYGGIGNNPVNRIDPTGLQSGCAAVAAEPTLLMSEEANVAYRAAQAAKKAKEIADGAKKAKQIADAAKKAKELKRVRDAEDAINKAKDIQKAQDAVRKGKASGKIIDRITKSEQNMKNQLKDIANDPSCAP